MHSQQPHRTQPQRYTFAMSMDAPLSIVLLVSSQELFDTAEKILGILRQDYLTKHHSSSLSIQIRSAKIPPERLLVEAGRPKIFVLLGPETPTSLLLRAQTIHPVVLCEDVENPTQSALSVAKFCALFSPLVASCVDMAIQSVRQASSVEDAAWKTSGYAVEIANCYDSKHQITGDDVKMEGRQRGKVRDRWDRGSKAAMLTTDRQSGFDRQLALVPFKGTVLNLCSQFWFEKTADIIPNHLLSVPHSSVAIVRRCEPFPIEFVVRYVRSWERDCS